MTHSHSPSMLFLIFIPLMLVSCICPLLPSFTSTTSTLNGDVIYTDSWYRETFDYARDAENIRHFVLVVPEDEAERATPGSIFTSLMLLPDGITLRDDRKEYEWALNYLHVAPEGYFTGAFEPGTYAVAAAFIAAPLSREEAGAEDAILWPGVTGGGASTEYQSVVLQAGETADIAFELTDADGWACPWLYVFDGQTFQRRTEILRNVRSRHLEQTEITSIGPVIAVDEYIVVRISEEKEEVSYIDRLTLVVGDTTIIAEADPSVSTALAQSDGQYLVLAQGESLDLRFRAPESFIDGDPVSVIVEGYYEPN